MVGVQLFVDIELFGHGCQVKFGSAAWRALAKVQRSSQLRLFDVQCAAILQSFEVEYIHIPVKSIDYDQLQILDDIHNAAARILIQLPLSLVATLERNLFSQLQRNYLHRGFFTCNLLLVLILNLLFEDHTLRFQVYLDLIIVYNIVRWVNYLNLKRCLQIYISKLLQLLSLNIVINTGDSHRGLLITQSFRFSLKLLIRSNCHWVVSCSL